MNLNSTLEQVNSIVGPTVTFRCPHNLCNILIHSCKPHPDIPPLSSFTNETGLWQNWCHIYATFHANILQFSHTLHTNVWLQTTPGLTHILKHENCTSENLNHVSCLMWRHQPSARGKLSRIQIHYMLIVSFSNFLT